MTARPHVLVLGLGIAGSSIAAHLAAKGYRVTGIEQFGPLHDRGSSHGDTRIFRRVPREGAAYVGMATQSWDGWQAWGRLAGEPLMVTCGGIDAGPEDSAVVAASEDLSRTHGLPCDILTGAAFNQRHPLFNLPPSWRVAFQPKSGFVRPDATRVFLHAWARSNGARLLHDTRVDGIDPGPNGVAVRTANETIEGDILIASAGGWMPKLFPDLALPLSPERRVIAWFDAAVATDGSVPIFCLDGEGGWYGMPTPDGTIKVGHDKHLHQRIDPDNPTLEPDAADAARLSPCVQRYFNGLSSEPAAMKACIYTLTPDKHFVVDRHPAHENIVLFSCCSGHGFKYAPAYGGIAEDFIRGVARPDLAVMALKRSGQRTVRYSE